MTEENKFPVDPPVLLRKIAEKFNIGTGSLVRYAKRRGFEVFKPLKGQNKPNFLSAQDARALSQLMEDERNFKVTPDQKKAPSGLSGVYVIQSPSYDHSIRLKIGWSDNVAERLDTYRTLVPDLRVSRIWRCPGNWCERMVLEWAKHNGKQISPEIFEFEDNDAALSSLDDLFVRIGIKPQTTTP